MTTPTLELFVAYCFGFIGAFLADDGAALVLVGGVGIVHLLLRAINKGDST